MYMPTRKGTEASSKHVPQSVSILDATTETVIRFGSPRAEKLCPLAMLLSMRCVIMIPSRNQVAAQRSRRLLIHLMIRIAPIRMMPKKDMFLPIGKRVIVQILFLRKNLRQTFEVEKTQTCKPNSHSIPLELNLFTSLIPPQKSSDVSGIVLSVQCVNEDATTLTKYNEAITGPDKAAWQDAMQE